MKFALVAQGIERVLAEHKAVGLNPIGGAGGQYDCS